MVWLRKIGLALHLLRGLVTCAVLFPWIGASARRWHIRRWSLRLLHLCGVRLELVGPVPEAADMGGAHGAMVVCNHISWLDIFVIHCWHPARFVAKSEIRGWPVIGWLCAQTGTLFIERGRKRDAHRVLHDIADCMLQGDRVCVFPEGTTTDGSDVLPFHANLMQAPISGGLPVLPVGLSYLDAATREPTVAPAYIGDLTLMQTLNAVLHAPPIVARLAFAPPLHATEPSRRALADASREAVAHLRAGAHEAAADVVARANATAASNDSRDPSVPAVPVAASMP